MNPHQEMKDPRPLVWEFAFSQDARGMCTMRSIVESQKTKFGVLCSKWVYKEVKFVSGKRRGKEECDYCCHFKKKARKLPPCWGNGSLSEDYSRTSLSRSLCSLGRYMLSLALIELTVFIHLLGRADTLICCNVRTHQPSQLCLCRHSKSRATSKR